MGVSVGGETSDFRGNRWLISFDVPHIHYIKYRNEKSYLEILNLESLKQTTVIILFSSKEYKWVNHLLAFMSHSFVVV